MIKGKITEIFESVQGEGIYAGERQLFVRFFGCNLNTCKFCDTRSDNFTEYTPPELLEKIDLYSGDYHSLSFTGGEPLLQKDFLREVLMLTGIKGFKNYLETNGTLPAALSEVIDYVDIVAMDFKLPSSTGLDSFWRAHRSFLRIASSKEVFLKVIICQSTQESDLMEAINLLREANSSAVLVLQPNFFEESVSLYLKIENFKDICIKNGITACVMAQMHKTMGIR